MADRAGGASYGVGYETSMTPAGVGLVAQETRARGGGRGAQRLDRGVLRGEVGLERSDVLSPITIGAVTIANGLRAAECLHVRVPETYGLDRDGQRGLREAGFRESGTSRMSTRWSMPWAVSRPRKPSSASPS